MGVERSFTPTVVILFQNPPRHKRRPYYRSDLLAVQPGCRIHRDLRCRRQARIGSKAKLRLQDQRVSGHVPQRLADIPQRPRPDLPVVVHLPGKVFGIVQVTAGASLYSGDLPALIP